MSIVVFYLEHTSLGTESKHLDFKDSELSVALAHCDNLRKRKGQVSHVVISSEMSGVVGLPGVSSVVDGKTPDGHPYDWSKSGRAGRFKAADAVKTHLKASDQ